MAPVEHLIFLPKLITKLAPSINGSRNRMEATPTAIFLCGSIYGLCMDDGSTPIGLGASRSMAAATARLRAAPLQAPIRYRIVRIQSGTVIRES